MDGWDGMVVQFFFAYILKNTQYFIVITSDPINKCFSTSFELFSEKNRNFLFFQKNSSKSNIPFFTNILTSMSQIAQKLLNIVF